MPLHQFVAFDPEAEAFPEPEPGGVVLVCGTRPLERLRQAKVVPKSRTLSNLREKPVARNGGWYLVSYDPALIANEPDKAEILDWDVRLAVRLIRTGGIAPELGTYKWVHDFAPLIARIEARFAATADAGRPGARHRDHGVLALVPGQATSSRSPSRWRSTRAEVLYLGPQPHPVPLDPAIPLYDQIQWLLTSPEGEAQARQRQVRPGLDRREVGDRVHQLPLRHPARGVARSMKIAATR